MDIPDNKYNYGIVIDSGSSGSRIQIYKWPDPSYVVKNTEDTSILQSPLKIVQEDNWTKKTSPGISTYHEPTKFKKIWLDHYSELITFAEDIIPKEKHKDTPIFVLATAGMRLLTPRDQKKILKEVCSLIKSNTNFLIEQCSEHVQIIDGSTEGIYGWLGLNYLMGQFDNYEPTKPHDSIGFMDMGGASTQIAFHPSSVEDIEKHREDIARVTIRNINGLTQSWDIFVETWLGFGANEARKRYLTQLINLSSINPNSGHINDPCSPRNANFQYAYEGKNYDIKGIGNYEMCIKTIYPLLLKNVPCKEEPCLFNGVHGPKLNFDSDKFVGISEYWYTANDVFQSGGEYNYKIFNERVKEYCESEWQTILDNSKNGQYSNLDPNKFLIDACFKASWVINVLHDGFELPRLGLEIPDKGEGEGDEKEITNVHVPFKSTDSVNGNELSWTLGKILLYASSKIPASNKNDLQIGVYPASITGKKFIPAASSMKSGYDSDDDDDDGNNLFLTLLVFAILLLGGYYLIKSKVFKNRRFNNFKKAAYHEISKIPYINQIFDVQNKYSAMQQYELDVSMEEGTLASAHSSPNLTQLRTRSALNLSEIGDLNDELSNSLGNNRTNFMNKPFVVPKKGMYQMQNGSRDSLQRSASAMSITRP